MVIPSILYFNGFLTASCYCLWCFLMIPWVFLRFPRVFLLFCFIVFPVSYFKFCDLVSNNHISFFNLTFPSHGNHRRTFLLVHKGLVMERNLNPVGIYMLNVKNRKILEEFFIFLDFYIQNL